MGPSFLLTNSFFLHPRTTSIMTLAPISLLQRTCWEKCANSEKYIEEDVDFWLGLLAYRTAPFEDHWSPGELLQGSCARTLLPSIQAQPTQRAEEEGVRDKQWTQRAQVVGKLAPLSYQVVTASCCVAIASTCTGHMNCSCLVQLKAMTRTARTQPRETTFRHSAQHVLLIRCHWGQSACPTKQRHRLLGDWHVQHVSCVACTMALTFF